MFVSTSLNSNLTFRCYPNPFLRLTQLSLSNTKLTDDGMKSLAGKAIFDSWGA